MKFISKIMLQGFMVIIFFISAETVSAQHDHGSDNHETSYEAHLLQPPHGGELKTAGKYKIELVKNLFLKTDQLTFYIFKGNLKTVSNEEITGTITINNETNSESTLEPKGNDHFVAQWKGTGPFQCNIAFIIKGKTVTTEFTHE